MKSRSLDLIELLALRRTQLVTPQERDASPDRPWQQATALAERWKALAGTTVQLVGRDPATTIVALAALDRLGCTTLLTPLSEQPPRRPTSPLSEAPDIPYPGTTGTPHGAKERRGEIGTVRSLVAVNGELRESSSAAVPAPILPTDCGDGGGHLVLHTSGTTGTPKPVRWSWRRLLKERDRTGGRTEPVAVTGVCFSAYPLDTFAGIQSLVYALGRSEALLLPETNGDALELLTDRPTTLAMATPTFWRRALVLGRPQLAKARIGTVSMGGEAADQDLLDDLAKTLPHTRIVHVYASTELGSLFSVSDGRAGLPAAWLGRRRCCGWTLDLDGDELVVRRDGETRPTGDRIELRGDRAFFAGRTKESINVGGRKLNPLRIETVLRRAPGVADLRVYGHPSPITGAVVAVDIVLKPNADRKVTRTAILAIARDQLTRAEVPRRLRMVDDLPLTRSGKIYRSPEAVLRTGPS